MALYLERKLSGSEAQVFGRHETRQKDVDAFTHTEWHSHHTIGAGLAVQTANEVGEVIEHAQIVLHHHHVSGENRWCAHDVKNKNIHAEAQEASSERTDQNCRESERFAPRSDAASRRDN